jgi:hypothetical protein
MERKGVRLVVAGSSSTGNGYALVAEKETLLLEAGVKFSQVQKMLNFKTENIVGVCISHSHG